MVSITTVPEAHDPLRPERPHNTWSTTAESGRLRNTTLQRSATDADLIDHVDAERARRLACLPIRISTDEPAAGRGEPLGQRLTNEAEPDQADGTVDHADSAGEPIQCKQSIKPAQRPLPSRHAVGDGSGVERRHS